MWLTFRVSGPLPVGPPLFCASNSPCYTASAIQLSKEFPVFHKQIFSPPDWAGPCNLCLPPCAAFRSTCLLCVLATQEPRNSGTPPGLPV